MQDMTHDQQQQSKCNKRWRRQITNFPGGWMIIYVLNDHNSSTYLVLFLLLPNQSRGFSMQKLMFTCVLRFFPCGRICTHEEPLQFPPDPIDYPVPTNSSFLLQFHSCVPFIFLRPESRTHSTSSSVLNKLQTRSRNFQKYIIVWMPNKGFIRYFINK